MGEVTGVGESDGGAVPGQPEIAPRDPLVTAVQRARDGDVAAFERVYRAQVGRIRALALRMSGDAALADELTQEVFVRAWHRLESFRGESSFATWLHTLAIRAIVDALRREDRTSEVRQVLEFTTTAPGRRIDLERAIALLPDRARQVLVLHDLEGWQHDEIAELMGITAGTCRSQLHRARALLKEALQ